MEIFKRYRIKKRYLFLLMAFTLLTLKAEAKYNQTCIVRYTTEEGWSKKYTVDVTFISGTELNEATNSYKYSSYSIYGVIFWGEGRASVIKISNFLSCGSEVTKSCITNTYGDIKGKDQDDDEWKICVSDYCY
ncbi:hypothetical protein D3C87_1167770 [compost metagenome]